MRVRDKTTSTRKSVSLSWVFLLCGLALGAAGGYFAPISWNRFAAVGPRTFTVGPAGITAALNLAHAGDTVVIPQGHYRERVELRQGVTLRAQVPGTVILTLARRRAGSGGPQDRCGRRRRRMDSGRSRSPAFNRNRDQRCQPARVVRENHGREYRDRSARRFRPRDHGPARSRITSAPAFSSRRRRLHALKTI